MKTIIPTLHKLSLTWRLSLLHTFMPYSLGKPKHSRHWTQSPGMITSVVIQLMMIMMMKLIMMMIEIDNILSGKNYYSRFTPVQNRPGIRICISEKFVEIFNWYESDLEEVHQIYDAHKVMIKIGELSRDTSTKCIIVFNNGSRIVL